MQFETERQYWPAATRFGAAACGAVAMTLAAAVCVALRSDVEPFRVFARALALALMLIVVQVFPVAPLVALVHVGTFKAHHAVGISLTDPTVLTLILLDAVLALQILFAATRAQHPTLRDLFSGQSSRVAAFFLLILVIVASYAYTPAPEIGGDKVLKLIAFDLPIFLAPLILLRDDRQVRQLVLLNLAASLALAGLTIHGVLHAAREVLSGERDATQIGPGLAIGAGALTILYYPLWRKRLLRMALLACLVVLTIGVTASLSRSAFLSFFIVAVSSLVFLGPGRVAFSRKALLLTLVAIILTAVVAAVWVQRSEATHSKFELKAQELLMALYGSGLSGTVGQRYSFSESAWRAFLAKPVLGWGAGGWSTLWHFSDNRVVAYPHNFVLEIAAEQGLVGLTALAALLFAMMRACRQLLKVPECRFTFIVPVVALSLLGNSVTGQVDDRNMWFWCGTLFALARIVRLQSAFIATGSRATYGI